jgi:hypothetical protein
LVLTYWDEFQALKCIQKLELLNSMQSSSLQDLLNSKLTAIAQELFAEPNLGGHQVNQTHCIYNCYFKFC